MKHLRAFLSACAPLPALIVGIVAMREMDVSTAAWSINAGATVLGLILWLIVRRLPPPARWSTVAFMTAAGIAAILLPCAFEGMLGVHRWVSIGGLRLHASAIAAPLIILCVAAAASRSIRGALAIGVAGTLILALQPDAAQATSFAAACIVALCCVRMKPSHKGLLAVLLCAISLLSFVRQDPLPPVPHVEGIYGVITSRGAGPAVMATMALMLLPAPFFVAWYRHRRRVALALGVYVAMTILAPAWGTFPVPVMGFGASPILGYFLALAIGVGRPSQFEDDETTVA